MKPLEQAINGFTYVLGGLSAVMLLSFLGMFDALISSTQEVLFAPCVQEEAIRE